MTNLTDPANTPPFPQMEEMVFNNSTAPATAPPRQKRKRNRVETPPAPATETPEPTPKTSATTDPQPSPTNTVSPDDVKKFYENTIPPSHVAYLNHYLNPDFFRLLWNSLCRAGVGLHTAADYKPALIEKIVKSAFDMARDTKYLHLCAYTILSQRSYKSGGPDPQPWYHLVCTLALLTVLTNEGDSLVHDNILKAKNP